MFIKRIVSIILSGSLLLATVPGAIADETSQPNNQSSIAFVKQTPEQLQQLVALIALYPDELVAGISVQTPQTLRKL